MTKKTFILAANQIKNIRAANPISALNDSYCDSLASEFANFFEKLNPLFDRAKFIEATY